MPRVYARRDPQEVCRPWFSLRMTPVMMASINDLARTAGVSRGEAARRMMAAGLNAMAQGESADRGRIA